MRQRHVFCVMYVSVYLFIYVDVSTCTYGMCAHGGHIFTLGLFPRCYLLFFSFETVSLICLGFPVCLGKLASKSQKNLPVLPQCLDYKHILLYPAFVHSVREEKKVVFQVISLVLHTHC